MRADLQYFPSSAVSISHMRRKRSQIKTGRVCGTSYYDGEDALSGYMHQAGPDARTPQPEPILGCIASVPDTKTMAEILITNDTNKNIDHINTDKYHHHPPRNNSQ